MTERAAATSTTGRPEFVHRSWPADPRLLAAIRTELRRWLAPLALSADAVDGLVLATDEAAGNCVKHAYPAATRDGTVALTFWTERGSVWVEVVDHGAWRPPTGPPTGCGRGIAIMQRLVPVVLIRHDRRGTRVLLGHPLPRRDRRLAAVPAGGGSGGGTVSR